MTEHLGLAEFQRRFADALTRPDSPAAPWAGVAFEPALSVYRNTVATACAENLAAIFPTVRMMVGADWFTAAATLFLRHHPPRDPRMTAYGQGFPEWLSAFPPAQDLAYLAACARLDLAWLLAHLAPDPPAPRRPPDFQDVEAAPLHGSVRLFRFELGIPSLWLAHRAPGGPEAPLELHPDPEFLVVWRPDQEVQARLLTPAEYAVLSACRDGASLRNALSRALAAGSPAMAATIFDLPSTLAAEGFFAGANPGAATP